ncbi:immunoglobulin-like domain-containing protein, partial [Listeria booriae]
EKEAQDKANEAVTNLFENNDPDGDIVGNLTQDDLDKAQDLINKVTDETKKAELQSSLDKAKQQLADRTTAEKEAQDAAKASVNDLFLNNDPTKDIKATTNQAAVNAAQEKVNTVTDPAVKEALQKQVDKAQAQVSARAGITGVITKYTVGDMYITGTYTGPATALSVDVNGKRYYGGDIANGTFKFYVADKNLKAGDIVIVNFYDSSKQIRTSVQVQVFEPLKVTVADYKIGDGYLTGTYNNNVAKVGLVVNGTKYWGGTVANGTVRFYAADKIRTADAEAVMNFYDENNNLLASKTIKIQAAYTGEITTAEFTLGATYITGELTGDITQTAISINGKKYYGGTIASNKTYKFYVLDKRITTADEVIVYGYSADNRLLSQKTVTITQ